MVSIAKIKELEKQVSSLQAELAEKSSSSGSSSSDESKTDKNDEPQNEDVVITVVDKVNIPQNVQKGIYSDQALFHISITNHLDKDIKGIQGTMDIQDMFGTSILKSQCDLTGYTIKPGETYVNKDLSLEINQFMSDYTKVYKTDFADLKFIYSIKTIMFADGTTK